ncbi:uncharacterized protein LOC111270137 isoform X2 [Varroa jacobsoni]|uniref:uncharacterized protein LOC111270137 isoform X2 n=1 Tax=Varroa jacobsoni TaxID=62625 RepID=UPI000BF535A4|nr:uncharacterized protein LOC111270137 isoform X2 [Varroa jacobsoni]
MSQAMSSRIFCKFQNRIICCLLRVVHAKPWKRYLIALTLIATVYVVLRQWDNQNSWLNYLLLNGDFGIDFDNFDNVLGAAFPIVPNIIHFIKIGNKSDLTFEELVCIKAAWLAQKPERILIHCDYCDYLKSGKYWSQVTRIPNLNLVPVSVPTHVWGRKLSSLHHASDVLRIRILQRYGGIYLDTDVFLIKHLDFYRRFELAIGVPPKQYLGTQVIVGHRSSRFLRLWLESYRYYKPDRWYYNAGELPTTSILFKKPTIVHAVPWDFGVHDLRAVLYNACSPRWRDFRAIHLLSRHRLDGVKPGDGRPISFNEENIKSYKKTFGEMARSVMYGQYGIISDDRPPLPPLLVALTNFSALPRYSSGCVSLHRQECQERNR